MLFVPATRNDLQTLINVAIDLNASEIVFWPIIDRALHSQLSSRIGFVAEALKELVTTYDDVTERQTPVYSLSKAKALAEAKGDDIYEGLDSIGFHRPDERAWTVCFIPHEAMAIVRDADAASILEEHGLRYSVSPPDGW